MPKFFVSPAGVSGETVRFGPREAAHMKVLRLRVGETLLLCAEGTDYTCALTALSPAGGEGQILSAAPAPGEPGVFAAVFAALPKGDKAETIVQKAVELGAGRVVFFLSERCVARPDEKAMGKRLERLNRVAEEAAMQSYRGRVPPVAFLPALETALAQAAQAQVRLFLWEEARGLSLKGALEAAGSFQTAALVTGPEGGFSPAEAGLAQTLGLSAVTLGKRILRCETAPLCALSALMYHTDELC